MGLHRKTKKTGKIKQRKTNKTNLLPVHQKFEGNETTEYGQKKH